MAASIYYVSNEIGHEAAGRIDALDSGDMLLDRAAHYTSELVTLRAGAPNLTASLRAQIIGRRKLCTPVAR
jgi:hypothetical protein